MEGTLDLNVDIAIGESECMVKNASVIKAASLLFEHVVGCFHRIPLDHDICRPRPPTFIEKELQSINAIGHSDINIRRFIDRRCKQLIEWFEEPTARLWRRGLLRVGVPCLELLEHGGGKFALLVSQVGLFTLIVCQVK